MSAEKGGRDLTDLVGRIAVTDTALLPEGTVVIDGEVYPAVSEGDPVDEGRGVRVTRVRGRKIFVRRV